MHNKRAIRWMAASAIATCLVVGCADDDEAVLPQSDEASGTSTPLHATWRAGVRMLPDTFTTSELGQTRTLFVRLTSMPFAPVSVDLSSSDPSEASVQPLRLVFTPFTWWIPRRVTVTGVSDLVLDGDVAFEVRADPSSRDPRYDRLDTVSSHGTNQDAAAFHGLGDLPGGEVQSAVAALSAAGDVAVGYSSGSAGDEAVRWTPEAQLQGLQGQGSVAHGVSPDGTLIVGSLLDARWDGGRAAVIWREPDAPPEYFHEPIVPPTNQVMWFVKATAVTNSGEAFGECVQYLAYGEHIACHTPIGLSTLLSASLLFAISPAGDSYVGAIFPPIHLLPAPFSSMAIVNGHTLGYPSDTTCLIPHGCESEARDLSADASVIIGTALVPPPGGTNATGPLASTAFVYTASEGMLRLPDLEDGESASGAYAISDDGAIIAGFGSDASTQQATVWIDREPVALVDLLSAAGATVPEGWHLAVALAMSSDGRTIAGNGINPAGEPEAWRAVLPDLR